MVWFQCEDCGENLKKPKLPNHFRVCSASKLSCIDCGVVFNRQSVQSHTQCISETEKYGPKGATHTKESVKNQHQEMSNDDVDKSLGLSKKAPWTCSLCNVRATSQETLLLHSQGKKHRSKARAISSKLQVETRANIGAANKESAVNGKMHLLTDKAKQVKALESTVGKHDKSSAFISAQTGAGNEPKLEKKRKKEDGFMYVEGNIKTVDTSVMDLEPKVENAAVNGQLRKKKKDDQLVSPLHGNEHTVFSKQQSGTERWSALIKWKKLIKQVLKAAPEGSMRLKKLCKSIRPLVIKHLETLEVYVEEESLVAEIYRRVHSCKKLVIEGKKVRHARCKTQLLHSPARGLN